MWKKITPETNVNHHDVRTDRVGPGTVNYIPEDPTEPFTMVLLLDPTKNTSYQYHGRMNVLGALETGRCSISRVDSSLMDEEPL
jgi:hypothetical protein